MAAASKSKLLHLTLVAAEYLLLQQELTPRKPALLLLRWLHPASLLLEHGFLHS